MKRQVPQPHPGEGAAFARILKRGKLAPKYIWIGYTKRRRSLGHPRGKERKSRDCACMVGWGRVSNNSSSYIEERSGKNVVVGGDREVDWQANVKKSEQFHSSVCCNG